MEMVDFHWEAYTETKNEHLLDNQVHFLDERIWPIHQENRLVASPTHWLSSISVKVQIFQEFPHAMGIPKTRRPFKKEN